MGEPAIDITRRHTRNQRIHPVRARSEGARAMTKRRLAIINQELGALDDLPERPKTRADCIDGPRPCPWVSCPYHLFLDVSHRTGSLKFNFPDIDVTEMEKLPMTCALDVAREDGVTLERVGQIMNLTRERVRQIEVVAMAKLKASTPAELHDFDAARFADEALDDE